MIKPIKTYTFTQLNKTQLQQYKNVVRASFPDVIFQSEIVKHCWPTIEKYFPEFQLFFIDSNEMLVGFLNSIPIYWDKPMTDLPDEGWDWLVEKGIEGYENKIKPNCLGGLQIIVTKEYLGNGYSKMLIAEGKKIQTSLGFKNFILPIRPTFKSKYPEMDMEEYIHFKQGEKIYDPWIRTHNSSGAKIIKVCPKAMHIKGDINYWEGLMNSKIVKSGYHIVEGALNPVWMDVEKDFGEYNEANIWIRYGGEL